jgi:hypothetical protein
MRIMVVFVIALPPKLRKTNHTFSALVWYAGDIGIRIIKYIDI